jgi:hypothetical protein
MDNEKKDADDPTNNGKGGIKGSRKVGRIGLPSFNTNHKTVR